MHVQYRYIDFMQKIFKLSLSPHDDEITDGRYRILLGNSGRGILLNGKSRRPNV